MKTALSTVTPFDVKPSEPEMVKFLSLPCSCEEWTIQDHLMDSAANVLLQAGISASLDCFYEDGRAGVLIPLTALQELVKLDPEYACYLPTENQPAKTPFEAAAARFSEAMKHESNMSVDVALQPCGTALVKVSTIGDRLRMFEFLVPMFLMRASTDQVDALVSNLLEIIQP